MLDNTKPSSLERHEFSGTNLLQIAMPMGGIGAGNLCLNGYGGVQDFSIRHKPSFSALPDGHNTDDAAFALLHIKGNKPVTRLLEGPLPIEKIYDQGLKAQGYRQGGHEGLPRFENCRFSHQYPFGDVFLDDEAVPLSVQITGWNPFIPLDDVNSGLPCAILEYKFKNQSHAPVDFDFSYHLSHLAPSAGMRNEVLKNERGSGVEFSNMLPTHEENFGSAALFAIGQQPKLKAMWFRGGWFDALSVLWREVSTGDFQPNNGEGAEHLEGRNGGSLSFSASLAPGESVTFPVVIAWHFPNVYQRYGEAEKECGSACDCSAENQPAWRPFYASQWQNAGKVALYTAQNYQTLRSRTKAFSDALFSSTLPAAVLDAVSCNLAILKSPTVLRQENGNLWAWEGCFTQSGCCHGTCTHVWNYAQALPHLFPALERTLREQELLRSINEKGHINFRAALPDGAPQHDYHAAADGQLGGILKLWRDYQICGNLQWLAKLFPAAKRSLDYCIELWDPQRQGGLFEPHHNTYDIEFWGPDGMCGSIYVGALSAMAEICRALGKDSEAAPYAELAERAARFLDQELFNGEYYQQKVQWENLRETSFAEKMAQVDESSNETLRLQKAEGPKYQYGSGCLSDGIIGAWMAEIYGVSTPLNGDNVRQTLRAIFQHNFKSDLSQHVCLQRPGYALGHEAGLLLCTWPRGGKPTLPFVYSDEVWTGIEYQVASHLIENGFLEEGLTIVEAVRSRYDGRVRNPFNEYECGSYYARAMASYAVLNSLSGFRYSAATKTLWFAPKLEGDFRCFFSTAAGYGTIELENDSLSIEMIEGELAIETLHLTSDGKTQNLSVQVVAKAGQETDLRLN
jgi:uncharacterized protein (DUF608 family)